MFWGRGNSGPLGRPGYAGRYDPVQKDGIRTPVTCSFL